MKATKKLSALAVAAALTLGVAANAQAGVLAQGELLISNFTFSNPDGSPIDIAQFGGTLNFQDSSQITATLNGVSQTGTINSSSFGVLDLPQQCVDITGPNGPVCATFGQNNFSQRLTSTTDVARGDSLLIGAPITVGGVPVPPSLGAQADLVAEAQLKTKNGTGNTSAELGLTASFQFVLGTAQTVTIGMNSISHLIAQLDAGSFGTARAAEGWTITVSQGNNTVFEWTPDGAPGGITGGTELTDTCDLTVVRSTQTSGTTSSYDCVGVHSARTNTLAANTVYTLSLEHTNSATVTFLPEPGSLALFGLGLAGLGFVGFRGRKLSA